MNIDSRLQSRPPAPAAWLGYGGLLPFIAMAAGSWLDARHSAAWQQAQVAYGAVILSFVGALHWAFAMRDPTENGAPLTHLYVWSVMPALAGWVALLLMQWRGVGRDFGSALLVSVFVVHYVFDRGVAREQALPAWYLPLRLQLTAVACACLLASMLARWVAGARLGA